MVYSFVQLKNHMIFKSEVIEEYLVVLDCMNRHCNKINYSHTLFKTHISMFRKWNIVNLIIILSTTLLYTILYCIIHSLLALNLKTTIFFFYFRGIWALAMIAQNVARSNRSLTRK